MRMELERNLATPIEAAAIGSVFGRNRGEKKRCSHLHGFCEDQRCFRIRAQWLLPSIYYEFPGSKKIMLEQSHSQGRCEVLLVNSGPFKAQSISTHSAGALAGCQGA